MERRRRIIELANEFDVLILEDSPYRELRFEGGQLPTLASLDTEGRVIHLGSFSKILAPGVRLGWVSAAPEILDKLSLLKLAADTQSSPLNMTAVTRFLSTLDIDATEFMADHALPEARVAYVPGGSFFPSEQRSNYARFSYSGQSDDEMVEALTRLGAILRSHI
ncbi:aminotransferase class I/II-fold pyridoxal phosphate-dependent enzyme [Brevibacterium marinum]|uniref:aminotransferase class I/II-fold pyridoxal phosphate-dependent enzyme n=1 Tax=Brevibacterium marinum TaxID=418643 RepID=UPI0024730827|nr:aminotransferase class I/II-fold pyridoxal phosphate-dependent enzyme [Brevibacterium marinum]